MISRIRSPEPIEELFVAHFSSIYRFAVYRVGREAAVDVAAETFAQAVRSAERLDPARDARAWLFGIANNVIRHHRRTEERRIRAYAAVERQLGRPGTSGHPAEPDDPMRTRLVEVLERLDAATESRCFSSRGQSSRTRRLRRHSGFRSGRCGRGFTVPVAPCEKE
jgi:DNA-directed RNA polymerase specialized sigma24 family protein